MDQKRKPIKSKKLRDSARGEDCTLNIAGVCNYDSSTTVLAHLPDDSGTGKMGGKSDDICAVYACSDCHDILDGKKDMQDYGCVNNEEWEDYDIGYQHRALKRTIRRMVENGSVVIK